MCKNAMHTASTKCTYQIPKCLGNLLQTDGLCNIFAKVAKIQWNNVDPANTPADYLISLQTDHMRVCIYVECGCIHEKYVMLQIVEQTLKMSIEHRPHTKQKRYIYFNDYTWLHMATNRKWTNEYLIELLPRQHFMAFRSCCAWNHAEEQHCSLLFFFTKKRSHPLITPIDISIALKIYLFCLHAPTHTSWPNIFARNYYY